MDDSRVDRIVARCTSMLESRLVSLNPEVLTLDDLAVLAQIAKAASGIRTKRVPETEDLDALLERAKGNKELMAALGMAHE